MSAFNILITGANRGIGLALCKQYQQRGATVFGVCRHVSPELESLGVRIVSGIDISHPASVPALRDSLANVRLDVVINNAGILRNEVLGNLDYDSIMQQFQVNALGPLRITEALLPQLDTGARIALITSRMGSIADNTSGGRYGYRMSKCALNIAGVSLAHDLKAREIAVGIFHPGLVGTDMIGGTGDVTPDEAAVRLMTRIDELNMNNSGSFWHANGESLPW